MRRGFAKQVLTAPEGAVTRAGDTYGEKNLPRRL